MRIRSTACAPALWLQGARTVRPVIRPTRRASRRIEAQRLANANAGGTAPAGSDFGLVQPRRPRLTTRFTRVPRARLTPARGRCDKTRPLARLGTGPERSACERWRAVRRRLSARGRPAWAVGAAGVVAAEVVAEEEAQAEEAEGAVE